MRSDTSIVGSCIRVAEAIQRKSSTTLPAASGPLAGADSKAVAAFIESEPNTWTRVVTNNGD